MFESIDELEGDVVRAVWAAREEAIEQGESVERAEELAAEVLGQAVEDLDPHTREKFERLGEEAARWYADHHQGFQERLYDRWRYPLDRYAASVALAIEFLQRVDKRERPDAERRNDVAFEVLTGICARACRVANAVHHLLHGGFPLDALARARTLHELAVTAFLIQESAGDPAQQDLAERFLLHGHIVAYSDALEYCRSAEQLGHEPIPDERLEDMRRRRDQLLQRFGPSYKNDYGWAAALMGKDRPSFKDLEEKVGLSHLRGYYRWSSQEVHSGPKGLRANEITFRGSWSRLVNRTNHHLADPAQIALIALMQCMSAFLVHCSSKRPSDVLYMRVMGHFVNQACHAFVEVQEQIEREEEELLRQSSVAEGDELEAQAQEGESVATES